jgi:hypothetical protein
MRYRNILASTSYFSASPHLTADNFPENSTTSGLVEGLVKAHEAYGVAESVPTLFKYACFCELISIQRTHPVRRTTQRTQRFRPTMVGVRIAREVHPHLPYLPLTNSAV